MVAAGTVLLVAVFAAALSLHTEDTHWGGLGADVSTGAQKIAPQDTHW
jgi:hypothetical protein